MRLDALISRLEELRKTHGDREVRGIDDVVLGTDGAVSVVSGRAVARSLGGFPGQEGTVGQGGASGQEGAPGFSGQEGFAGQQGFAGTPG
jgi:hypothetical protein